MITVGVNKDDLKRITDKLAKLHSVDNIGHKVYNYRMDILENYKTAVVSLMGTVSHSGGMVSVNFLDKSQMTYWEGLAEESTLALKKAKGGWKLEIWEASGETKRAVKIRRREGFVGIDKTTDYNAFEKAISVEFGGNVLTHGAAWAERGLFTIANNIFIQNRDLIVKAIGKLVVEDIGWGK